MRVWRLISSAKMFTLLVSSHGGGRLLGLATENQTTFDNFKLVCNTLCWPHEEVQLFIYNQCTRHRCGAHCQCWVTDWLVTWYTSNWLWSLDVFVIYCIMINENVNLHLTAYLTLWRELKSPQFQHMTNALSNANSQFRFTLEYADLLCNRFNAYILQSGEMLYVNE